MTDPAPEAIPGYRILRELGRGGMATVYLAVQESLGREVALKLLSLPLAADPASAERFIREARTAARLQHRHIVGIHDVGQHGGQPYLAMEFLPGTVAGERLEPKQALEVARDVALALDHAHAQGVIHRDVKPDNILRRADGSHALADFGIARSAEVDSAMTQVGTTLGTPHYMSPEQLQGQALDGRADLYSLGVVLFELLTGSLPYEGTDGWAVGMQHISASLPRLPDSLSRYQPLIDTLMAKQPAQRPATGAEAARLIESLQAASGHPDATQYLQPTLPRRRQSGRLAIAAVALLALAGTGWYFIDKSTGGDAAPATAAVSPASERSIAVLPLTNLSGDPANEYFSDGLAETTLDMLARVPDLKVIARTSSFAFKGKSMDVRQIGKALDVAHLLEGSVQQSGQTVRITVQLVRTRDGAHVWSQRYDRQLADVFRIQDEVATEVVKALQGALPSAGRQHLLAKRTDNIAAYQEYLKGTALLPNRRVADMRVAARHFERAISIDPTYARAYAAAAVTYGLLLTHAEISAEESQRRSSYIDRALELAPDLGEAHIALGGLLEEASDIKGAERAYQRGIELAPGFATGYQWYGEFEMYVVGRPDRAMPLLERAVALDPLSPIVREQYLFGLASLGRVDEALAMSECLIANNPGFIKGHRLRADLLGLRGDLAGALREQQKAIAREPENESAKIEVCGNLLRFGAVAEARQCLSQVAEKHPISDRQRSLASEIAAAGGDFTEALRLADSLAKPSPWQRAGLLGATGKSQEALIIYRQMAPELFNPTLVDADMGFPTDAIVVGISLMNTGETQRGSELLRLGVRRSSTLPHSGPLGRGWTTVVAYTLLGQLPKACAELAEAVGKGHFQNYLMLEADPALAPLRQRPCFQKTMSEIRRVATEKVQLARQAKLI